MRRRLFVCGAGLLATILLATMSVSPAGSQDGDEWTGTISDEDLKSNEQLLDSFVSIVRLADGTFLGNAYEDYVSNPGQCGESFFRRYEGTGVLSPGGETISFEGTLSGLITSTCGDRVTETGGPASFTVAVDGGNISGYFGVGFIDLDGPTVALPVPPFTVEDGVLRIETPPGEVLELSRADLPAWAGYQIAVVGAVAVHAGPPDTVVSGDVTALLDGMPIARVGDTTAHGGEITSGSDVIFVNGQSVAVVGSETICPMVTPVVPHVGGPIVLPASDLSAGSVAETCDGCDPRAEAVNTQGWTAEQIALLDAHLSSSRLLASPAVAGATTLDVDGAFVEVGDGIAIGSGEGDLELAVVAGKGSIILDRPLEFDHGAGTVITRLHPEDVPLIAPPPTSAAPDDAASPDPTVEPDAAAPSEPAGESTDSGGSGGSLVLVLGAIAVGAVAVGVALARRGRSALD